MITVVAGHVLTGLQNTVMMIGHSTATALVHPLEKSRTLAVKHVAFVVSNVFHDSKTAAHYNYIYIYIYIMHMNSYYNRSAFLLNNRRDKFCSVRH